MVDDGCDNFAPLRSVDWQAHVHGAVRAGFATMARSLGLPVHRFEWTEAGRRAGLRRDAAYVVRPDGHVGFADPAQDGAALGAYFARIGVRPGAAPA